MTKIRKLYYFDKKNVEEMISALNNSATDKYINHFMFNPFLPLHHFLPLNLKFLPESYVLKDKDEFKGLITVAPNSCGRNKVEIQKLFFDENSLVDTSELVQYVVSKYKAMGAISILVKIDDYLLELLSMFVSKCGFSQISYEKLWRINLPINVDFDKKEFRSFRNSDSQIAVNLYNDTLLPHFRPILSKEVQEFNEPICKGLTYFNEYKYVMEDKQSKNILAYISIKTGDNENYIVDIIQANYIDVDINTILAFAYNKIKQRKKKFGFFVKTKRYTSFGDKYEEIFSKNGFKCVQNQILLTNSSLKILKEDCVVKKYSVISDFRPINVVSTKTQLR